MATPSKRPLLRRVRVIDSHTEGEPTRVVLSGGPDLGDGTLEERLHRFRSKFDHFRRAIVNEPRGAEPVVGALLCTPDVASSAAGVVFFNNIGYLGMCGHGTIGLVATLAHLGRWGTGRRTIDTPVGPVLAEYHGAGRTTIWNVPSFRTRARVAVDVPGYSRVTGDVAWGGNWFFLVDRSPLELRPENARALTRYCLAIERALVRQRITGSSGEKIEHIELSGPPAQRENHSRNFVLCPGGAYDRSPCGTGTSAKMACLVADRKLAPGEPWRQEGILGGVFEGRAELVPDGIRPRITGHAYLTGEGDLLFDDRDPFRHGVPVR
ncbi:MAG TPA: proline racemase family protein [Thermoplasmata archaeon]|nr:proline racemase family protein [Thermoplasmata archaeon]